MFGRRLLSPEVRTIARHAPRFLPAAVQGSRQQASSRILRADQTTIRSHPNLAPMLIRRQASARRKTLLRRTRIPNRDEARPDREIRFGRRRADSRLQIPEPAGQEARSMSTYSRIQFRDCSLRNDPAAASAMVKHSAQLYASILHARAVRTPTTVGCTAAPCLSGPGLLAGARRARLGTGSRRQ